MLNSFSWIHSFFLYIQTLFSLSYKGNRAAMQNILVILYYCFVSRLNASSVLYNFSMLGSIFSLAPATKTVPGPFFLRLCASAVLVNINLIVVFKPKRVAGDLFYDVMSFFGSCTSTKRYDSSYFKFWSNLLQPMFYALKTMIRWKVCLDHYIIFGLILSPLWNIDKMGSALYDGNYYQFRIFIGRRWLIL